MCGLSAAYVLARVRGNIVITLHARTGYTRYGGTDEDGNGYLAYDLDPYHDPCDNEDCDHELCMLDQCQDCDAPMDHGYVCMDDGSVVLCVNCVEWCNGVAWGDHCATCEKYTEE